MELNPNSSMHLNACMQYASNVIATINCKNIFNRQKQAYIHTYMRISIGRIMSDSKGSYMCVCAYKHFRFSHNNSFNNGYNSAPTIEGEQVTQ